MKKTITFLSIVLTGFLSVTGAKAQFSQTVKIVSENRESRAEYGTSVAIRDNYAVVGAARENIASGNAYVYHKDGAGDWSFLQSFSAPDPNEGAEYGGGAKISGDQMVIAAGRANVAGLERVGALYTYHLNGSAWVYDTKLVASDYSSEAKLGMNPTSLALQNTTIVAGAPGENGWTGSVYIFEKTAGTWTEKQKLMSPNPQQNVNFGIGVAIMGDYIVVGASEEGNTKGAVYIYKKNTSGIWEPIQKLTASDAMAQAYFGTSVSMVNGTIAVGAYGDHSETGAAYIFEEDGTGNWNEVQKITASTPSSEANFGWNCKLEANYLVVSAPHPYGVEKGEVYIYKKNGGSWVEIQKVESFDLAPEDFYGWNIETDGDQLIVGAPWEDEDENGGNPIDRAGSAYIFKDPTILGVNTVNLEGKISVYPNPTNNIITINSTSYINSITLSNQFGSILKQQHFNETTVLTLDISQYAKGLYFLRIKTADGRSMVEKILLQ